MAWLARELFPLGLRVEWQVTVPDGPAIRDALAQALQRSDLILVTGGLGPTSDDITRDVAAELLDRPLATDPAILEKLHAYFRGRNITPDPSIARQAQVPRDAFVLPNNHGTAPGLILEEKGKIVVLLPGPPRELKPMWRDAFVPWLKARGTLAPLQQRIWNIVGIGESRVQGAIEADLRAMGDFEIGYCARSGEVDFRLIHTDTALLDRGAALVRERFRENIATENGETLEACVIRLATKHRLKIATAESCTGGLVAHRLTNIPGSSAVFEFGWVTYANQAKHEELGVPFPLFADDGPGAVSEETARAMAEGARSRSGADLAVAITGIAGPEGGTPEKPVGTVWLSLATSLGTQAVKKNFSTDRETFKYMASQTALDLLRRELERH